MPKTNLDVWLSSLLSGLLVFLKTFTFVLMALIIDSTSEEAPTDPTQTSQIASLPRNTDPTDSDLLVSIIHLLVSTELWGLSFTLKKR